MWLGIRLEVWVLIVAVIVIIVLFAVAYRRYEKVYHTSATPFYINLPLAFASNRTVSLDKIVYDTPIGKIGFSRVDTLNAINETDDVVKDDKSDLLIVVSSFAASATTQNADIVNFTVFNRTDYPIHFSGATPMLKFAGGAVTPATGSSKDHIASISCIVDGNSKTTSPFVTNDAMDADYQFTINHVYATRE